MQDSESGSGCGKFLLGCGIFILVSGLILVIGGYVAMFHTPLPAKGIAAILNQAPGVNIDGISGSIKSGFGVESIRITDDNGNVNSLTGARLHYEQEGDTFTITDLNLSSAHFYYNSNQEDTGITSTSSGSGSSHSSTTTHTTGQDFTFIIQKANITDVKVEDADTGDLFELKNVQLENLVIGEEFELGKFVIDSSTCQLSVLPQLDKPKSYTVEGRLEANFHKSIKKPLELTGEFDVPAKEEFNLQLAVMGGSVTINSKGKDDYQVAADNLNPGDYFSNLPPITNFSVTVSDSNSQGVAKGSFQFGKAAFTIDQTVDTSADNPPIIATHKAGATSYTLKLLPGGTNSFGKFTLEAEPEKPLKQALAALLFDSSPDALTPEQTNTLEAVAETFKASSE